MQMTMSSMLLYGKNSIVDSHIRLKKKSNCNVSSRSFGHSLPLRLSLLCDNLFHNGILDSLVTSILLGVEHEAQGCPG